MSLKVEEKVANEMEQEGKARLSWAKEWLRSPKGLYINGEWTDSKSGQVNKSTDPASGELLGTFAEAGKDDVDRAVSAARQAFTNASWRKMARRERADLLRQIAGAVRKHHAGLATLEALDNGKLYKEAFNDDIPEVWQVFEYYAGWTDKYYAENCPVDDGFINYTVREPLGVCGLIVPWNSTLR